MCNDGLLTAVIFDLDGVMVDSIPLHLDAFDRAFARYGLALADLQGDHRASSVEHILHCVQAELGVAIEPGPFNDELTEHIVAGLEGVQVDPDLERLIKELRGHRVKLAVGSSATRASVFHKLHILGVADYFEVVVGAEDVTRHKPHPDVYLAAAKKLGAIPSKCVVIEDADAGVAAARAAGIPVVGFGAYNQAGAPAGTDRLVTGWSQLDYPTLCGLVA